MGDAGKRGTGARLIWQAAALANRLHRTCWADLASWALGREGRAERRPLRGTFTAPACRREAATPGGPASCYCGKFRQAGQDHLFTEPARPWQIVQPDPTLERTPTL